MSKAFTKQEAYDAFKWICRCLQDAWRRGDYLTSYPTDLAEDAAWLYGYYHPSNPDRRFVWMVRDNGTHLTSDGKYLFTIKDVFGPDGLFYAYDADLETNSHKPVGYEEAKAFLNEPNDAPDYAEYCRKSDADIDSAERLQEYIADDPQEPEMDELYDISLENTPR